MIGGVFTDEVGGKLYAFVKSSDIPGMLSRQFADVGFVGSDKITEARLADRWTGLADEPIASANCSMVAASNLPYGIRPENRIVTSYPLTSMRYFNKLFGGFLPKIAYVPSGSVEGFVRLGVADGVVDIREEGKTLVDNGLLNFTEIEPVTTNIMWRTGPNEPELDLTALIEAQRRIASRRVVPGSIVEERHLRGKTLTTKLFNSQNGLVKKINSEAGELIREVILERDDELVFEAADLLYAVSIALISRGRTLTEALNELSRRNNG